MRLSALRRGGRGAIVLLSLLATTTACAGSDAGSVRTVTVTVTAPAPPEGAVVTALNRPGFQAGPSEGARPAKYVYKVLGNYRATQLRYTASNGDMESVNDIGTVDSGSDLPWTGEAAPEPNGNANTLSASTLSEKGNSYITCTIEDDKGNVVATDTGRGAYAGCYASTPR